MSVTLPLPNIQCDWDCVLREGSGNVWVSYKFKDEKSKDGVIKKIGNFLICEPKEFAAVIISKDVLELELKQFSMSTIFLAPIEKFTAIHDKSVISLSTTSVGLAVSACTNKVVVWNLKNGDIKCELKGHVGTVYKCCFFPSEQVILTCASDMQIKIWSAETGICPVSLSGHKMAVTDVAIVDRGRNIISVSKDGSAKLWHCGKSECIGDIICISSSINCCDISKASASLNIQNQSLQENHLEIACEDKVILIGCEDGLVYLIALKSRCVLFTLSLESAINCVCFLSAEHFLVGCQNGNIILYDVKKIPDSVNCWLESNSAILSILRYDEQSFFSARADGSVMYKSISKPKSIILTGPNFDPVYDLATDGKFLYTCCRDAIIRKYNCESVIRKIKV